MNILKVLGLLVFPFFVTGAVGLFLSWLDRKVTARIHWRKGPPWYQPIADLIKLFSKKPSEIEEGGKFLYYLLPALSLLFVVVAGSLLWGATFFKVHFQGDVIAVFLLLLAPSILISVRHYRSENAFVSIGARREAMLLAAYGPPLLITLLVAGATAGVPCISAMSDAGTLIAKFPCLIAFVVSIFCSQALLGLKPFDIAEAETEIMDGALGTYSGRALALLYLTRCMMLALAPLLLVSVFLGGLGDGALQVLLWVVKYLAVFVVFVLIKNTNPRIKPEQAVKFFCFGMTPIAALMLCLALLGL